jgi:hypothetical protein
MASPSFTGSAPPSLPGPDSHGQAALLLVETLIHGLVARSVLTTPEAVSILQDAFDVQLAAVDEAAPSASTTHTLALLSLLLESLKLDLPR